jgi:large repetitive protein
VRRARLKQLLSLCCFGTLSAVVAFGQQQQQRGQIQDLTMWQGDFFHTGLNSTETSLTPAVVRATGNFGLLFTQKMQGQTFGQILYVSKNTLNGLPGSFTDQQQHAAVYVATEHGMLYCWDAEGVNNNTPLWTANLVPAGAQPLASSDTQSNDIHPELGITETPVIDTTTSTIYVVVTIKNPAVNPPYQQLLYALDLKTGLPKPNVPSPGYVVVSATFPSTLSDQQLQGEEFDGDLDPVVSSGGQIAFSPLHEHERAAMTLYNGILYLLYASHSDGRVYHGEIIGYDPNTLQVITTFNTSPNDTGAENGLWMSGAGPAIDLATGNMYISVANGAFDNHGDWGESILKLPTGTNGPITLAPAGSSDTSYYWVPGQWSSVLNQGDLDLGSGGLLLPPDQTGTPHPHILIGGGKQGDLYVLDRDNLGGLGDANNSNAIQVIKSTDNGSQIDTTPAYFNNNIYYGTGNGHLFQRQLAFEPATQTYVSPVAIVANDSVPQKGILPFITSNGNTNGIVWAINNALIAYDATNIQNHIFSSNTNVPGTGAQCQTAKFNGPISMNGRVYLTCFDEEESGTDASGNPIVTKNDGYLFVYGIEPVSPDAPSAPINLTATANSANQVTLSWTPGGSNQTLYNVYRSTSPTGFGKSPDNNPSDAQGFLQSTTQPTFIDTMVTAGTTYFYQVTAQNTQESNFSNQVSATTFPAPVTPGLRAYWNFDGVNGTQVPDVTGNGHNGVIEGEAGATDALFNGGVQFHGTNVSDDVQVSDAPDLDFGLDASFTLDAWIQAINPKGQEQALIVKSHDAGKGYGLYINSANQWIARSAGVPDLVGPVVQPNVWTNVTLVQDGNAGIRTLYINGAAVASGPAADSSGTGPLFMGSQSNSGTREGFQGEIDEVRIYNTALTAGGIADTLAPALLEAVSTQTQGQAGPFGLILFPPPLPQTAVTEPRQGTTPGTYNITLHFSTGVEPAGPTLQTAFPASLSLQGGGTAVGNISATADSNDKTAIDVVLTGVQNSQALDIHIDGIVPIALDSSGKQIPNPSAVAGTADVPFDLLVGDVTGDHFVDGADVTGVKGNDTSLVSATNGSYLYDVNSDGTVNDTDSELISQAPFAGTNLKDPTDAPLARYKTAVDSVPPKDNGDLGNPNGRVPALAFDNDPSDNSRWGTLEGNQNPPVDPSWLVVDLGHVATIDQMQLKWNAAAADYTLWVHDDTPLTSPAVPVDPATNSPSPAQGGWIQILPGGVSPGVDETNTNNAVTNTLTGFASNSNNITKQGRYVLMFGKTRVGSFGYSLDDFQIYGSFSSSGSNPGSGTAPDAPTNLQITAATGQITLSWTASAGATNYRVFRGTTAGGETILATAPGTSFTDTSVVPGTTYFYFVEAVSTTATSVPSTEVSATPPLPAMPSAPTGLTATFANGLVSLAWNPSTGATSYKVFRSTTSGAEDTANPIATNVTSPSFSDGTAAPGTTNFYTVEASNIAGDSTMSNEASVALPAQQPILQIDAGSTSPVAPFSADEFFNGGGTSGTNALITIPATLTNPAPAQVYQTNRFGNPFSYNITGLTPNTSYTVLLDFAENFFATAGSRSFNVAINGVQKLQDFDIVKDSGGPNVADVQTFPGIVSNGSGQITISFTAGSHDQPQVNGIRILSTGGTIPAPPAPVSLFATPGNNQVSLTWNAGLGTTGTFSVLRGTAAGAESSTPIISGLTGTSFIDHTVVNGTTYFYTVVSSNSGGPSSPSQEVSTTPGVPVTGTPIIQIAAGGSGSGTFVADTDFNGGGTSGSGNTIITTAVVSPAPQVVYQGERSGGSFSYTIPTPTPNTIYLVRLHFAETFFSQAGQRVFNVSINGAPVLTNFDIVRVAGAQNLAVVEQFPATSDSQGNITVNFTPGNADQPKVSGIEVYPQQ